MYLKNLQEKKNDFSLLRVRRHRLHICLIHIKVLCPVISVIVFIAIFLYDLRLIIDVLAKQFDI